MAYRVYHRTAHHVFGTTDLTRRLGGHLNGMSRTTVPQVGVQLQSWRKNCVIVGSFSPGKYREPRLQDEFPIQTPCWLIKWVHACSHRQVHINGGFACSKGRASLTTRLERPSLNT